MAPKAASTAEHDTSPPAAPALRRRVGAPLLLGGRVLAVLALPAAAALGYLGEDGWQRVLRVVIVFGVLLALFRLIGKRELSRLSPFELVTLMLVPEVLSNALQGQGELLGSLVGLSTLLLLVLTTSVFSHRFKIVEKVVEASPTLLVSHGRLIEDALNRERITPDELVSEMHRQGMSHVSEIKWALLESSGDITFVPIAERGPTRRHTELEPR